MALPPQDSGSIVNEDTETAQYDMGARAVPTGIVISSHSPPGPMMPARQPTPAARAPVPSLLDLAPPAPRRFTTGMAVVLGLGIGTFIIAIAGLYLVITH
jgi:hypothetical protein